MAVSEPSRAEIPSRFGCRSKVAIEIPRVPAMVQRGLDVLAIGFVARRRPVVPITVENRSIR